MALTAFRIIVSFSIINAAILQFTSASEEVVVVHAPESIKFLSSEPMRSSYLGDIFSSMLGYTIRSNIEWSSLKAVVPWRAPEAVVVLELLGFDTGIDLPLEGVAFILENRGDLSGQYDLTAHRTEERYFGKNPVMLHMDLGSELHESKIAQPVLLKSISADPEKRLNAALSDPELGELVQRSTFNLSLPSDTTLLTEVATIKELLKAMSRQKSDLRNKVPDIYWLKITGLEPVVSYYGPDSLETKEALRLLRQVVSEVERTVRNVYDDKVVVTVIKTSSGILEGHKGRKLLAATEAPVKVNSLNLAAVYDPMFPVAFIIFVFIFLLLTLAVLGISVALWNMDPGRDSMVYRHTSTRIKKD